MLTLAKLSIRRPKLSLASWLAVAVVLSLVGLGVDKTLSPSVTVVKGTQSAQAQRLANAQFGPTQLVPIMLEGPKAELDRQGPKLVLALTRRPHTRVLSAWDAGTASAGLRPSATAAMIVVSVDRTEANVVKQDQPQIEALVTRQVKAPVKPYITGQPAIDRALKDASLNTLQRDLLIATGILFVLLIVGLRAPVAAALVVGTGAISMLAGFGEVAILGHVMKLDPVGVALGTMTGLATGVAFALLILDRFHREEGAPGDHPRKAVTAAMIDLQTTGRAVLVAATALIVALALVAVVGPTELMVSLGTGMLTCAIFATIGAVVVMPAALVLLGRRLEWLSFPAPRFLSGGWTRLVSGGSWVTRHALYTGFAATAILVALAVPAFALHTGAPDVTQLPKDSKARIAFQEISRVMGPGWATPYNLIIASATRPITTPALLASVEKLQVKIAKDGTVYSVTGPGTINTTANQLSTFWPQIKKSAKISDTSKKDLLKLIAGLGLAENGSSQLQSGLAQASNGASQLHAGSGQAQSGAGQLHSGNAKALAGASALHSGSGQAQSGATLLHAGLAKARTGSTQLSAGLTQALDGATALKNGAGQVLAGSSKLTAGLATAHTGAAQAGTYLSALSSLSASAASSAASLSGSTAPVNGAIARARAAAATMTTGKSDPHYEALVGALQEASGSAAALQGEIATASGKAQSTSALASAVAKQAPALVTGLGQLSQGAGQLEAGITQLRDGNVKLASGMSALNSGGSQLNGGLGQLNGGAGQLEAGLGQLTSGAGQLQTGLGALTNGAGQLETGLGALTNGTGQLQSGLAGGVGPAGQLVTGLGVMQASVIKARGQLPSTADLYKLERQSPGLFSSGYFVLAAVAGAQPSDRNAATFAVNVMRGGTAAQIVVVSKYKASDPRTSAMATRLAGLGRTFGKANNAEVAMGGPAGALGDLTQVTKSRVPLAIVVLAAALFAVLAIAVRAVVLPAVATVFSLLVSAASFGVLQVLFGGSSPPLGGPGYLDPMTVLGIFTVTFGVSVSFAAMLLMRTREARLSGEPGRAAIGTALRETAAPATGAGLVMIAALIPFATTELINVRQFGIGVAVAVLLETLLVRPVLLPAAETVFGRFGWWPSRLSAASLYGEKPRRPRRRPHIALRPLHH